MEEKKKRLNDEMLDRIISAIKILKSSGKIDALEKINKTMKSLKGRMDDEQITFLLKQVGDDGRITKIALMSGCLSEEGVIAILKENHFDPGLCEDALDTYTGDDFARNLLERSKEDSKVLKVIVGSSSISPEFKMLLAIKSGYNPAFCRGDACNAAASLLAAIVA